MVDPRSGGQALARRQLLTDEERQALLGFPIDPDGLTRCFTLSRSDRDLVAERRNDTSRLGYAVQLARLRHPFGDASARSLLGDDTVQPA